jgi:hypothetical protein
MWYQPLTPGFKQRGGASVSAPQKSICPEPAGLEYTPTTQSFSENGVTPPAPIDYPG